MVVLFQTVCKACENYSVVKPRVSKMYEKLQLNESRRAMNMFCVNDDKHYSGI